MAITGHCTVTRTTKAQPAGCKLFISDWTLLFPFLPRTPEPCWHSYQLLLILLEISALWPLYIWKLSWDHWLILHRSLKWLPGCKVFGLLSAWRTSVATLLWGIPYSFTFFLLVVNKSQALKVDYQAQLYLLTIYKSFFFAYTNFL